MQNVAKQDHSDNNPCPGTKRCPSGVRTCSAPTILAAEFAALNGGNRGGSPLRRALGEVVDQLHLIAQSAESEGAEWLANRLLWLEGFADLMLRTVANDGSPPAVPAPPPAAEGAQHDRTALHAMNEPGAYTGPLDKAELGELVGALVPGLDGDPSFTMAERALEELGAQLRIVSAYVEPDLPSTAQVLLAMAVRAKAVLELSGRSREVAHAPAAAPPARSGSVPPAPPPAAPADPQGGGFTTLELAEFKVIGDEIVALQHDTEEAHELAPDPLACWFDEEVPGLRPSREGLRNQVVPAVQTAAEKLREVARRMTGHARRLAEIAGVAPAPPARGPLFADPLAEVTFAPEVVAIYGQALETIVAGATDPAGAAREAIAKAYAAVTAGAADAEAEAAQGPHLELAKIHDEISGPGGIADILDGPTAALDDARQTREQLADNLRRARDAMVAAAARVEPMLRRIEAGGAS